LLVLLADLLVTQWWPGPKTVPPGDVVAVGHERSRARQPGGRRVPGVVEEEVGAAVADGPAQVGPRPRRPLVERKTPDSVVQAHPQGDPLVVEHA
jgi:hypothetical protein